MFRDGAVDILDKYSMKRFNQYFIFLFSFFGNKNIFYKHCHASELNA